MATTAGPAPMSQPRILSVNGHHFSRVLTLHSTNGSGPPLFTVVFSDFTIGKPNITVHRGPDESGQALFTAKYHAGYSITLKALLTPYGPVEVDIERRGLFFRTFRFNTGGQGQRDPISEYEWKPTDRHDKKLIGDGLRFGKEDYKCVQVTSKQVVALYIDRSSLGHARDGEFRFFATGGEVWDGLVMIAGLVTVSKLNSKNGGGE